MVEQLPAACTWLVVWPGVVDLLPLPSDSVARTLSLALWHVAVSLSLPLYVFLCHFVCVSVRCCR